MIATIFWNPSTPAPARPEELCHAAAGDPLQDLVLPEAVRSRDLRRASSTGLPAGSAEWAASGRTASGDGVALGREGSPETRESVRESRRSTSESVVVFDSGLAGRRRSSEGHPTACPEGASRPPPAWPGPFAQPPRTRAPPDPLPRGCRKRCPKRSAHDAPRTSVSPRGVLAATPVAVERFRGVASSQRVVREGPGKQIEGADPLSIRLRVGSRL